jgi:hypothetical protein
MKKINVIKYLTQIFKMFTQKASMRESADNKACIAYYPHSRSRNSNFWKPHPYIQYISIDPAIANYSIYIERRYKNGWIIGIESITVSLLSKDDKDGVNSINLRLINMLDKLQSHFSTTHVVVIERQMAINYFIQRMKDLPNLPVIIELDSKIKYRYLGAPDLIKKELKKWTPVYASKLLKLRKDDTILDILSKSKKKDDLADCICQLEALLIMWGEGMTKKAPRTIKRPIIILEETEQEPFHQADFYLPEMLPVPKETKAKKKMEKMKLNVPSRENVDDDDDE